MSARSDELDGLLVQVKMTLNVFPRNDRRDAFFRVRVDLESIAGWRRDYALSTAGIARIKQYLGRAKELMRWVSN